ncbi:MAG: YafY family transcriptional regulator [Alphaproteobacteria bacterium]|nr:YafY family transcriptional regulator [Alphaproteobacteria bacterium]
MRRTDRLFEILQLFRGGRSWRGRDIAERLEVSVRTIYRDIDTLVASGVPIDGERGVGYLLREPIFLPPLTLNIAELEALHLGMEMVRQSADVELADAAGRLLDKIDAVLPSDRAGRDHLGEMSVYAGGGGATLEHLAELRRAVAGRQRVDIGYQRLDGQRSTRRIRPLHIEYWGRVWTLTAWCEWRDGFRVFRIDRISAVGPGSGRFAAEPGKDYAAFLVQMEGKGASR